MGDDALRHVAEGPCVRIVVCVCVCVCVLGGRMQSAAQEDCACRALRVPFAARAVRCACHAHELAGEYGPTRIDVGLEHCAGWRPER